jgi:hypothetical protein
MFGGAVPSSEFTFLEKSSCHVNKNLLKKFHSTFQANGEGSEKISKGGRCKSLSF